MMKRIILLATSLVIVAWSNADAYGPRSRDSFDKDWYFARFGEMPDGGRLPEPGASSPNIKATASSEQRDLGNLPSKAVDDDPYTRWCAIDGRLPQWLQLDLGSAQPVGRVEVDWEFSDPKYQFVGESSVDGQSWQPLPAKGRYVRIRPTALPADRWASIREVRVFDDAGRRIENRKPSADMSPQAVEFDDSEWRKLNVPHDWAIEGPFRDDLENNTAKLPWKGIGWYRKHFSVPASDKGRRIFVDFDGAMANAKVWCNGQYVGTWPYGYQSFRLELTPHLKFGGENVLAVRLDTEQWGSRWYPGAGIYRNVWLVKTTPVHVAHWGVFATTQGNVAKFAVTVDNQSDATAPVSVGVEIPGVAQASPATTEIAAGQSETVNLSLTVPQPRLWDLQTPNLYTARVPVSMGGKAVDIYEQAFGFRTIEFTARDGFKLNGRRVPINGTCNHHDLGALGAAMNRRALERQLEILKEMGCNALRTSHNPPAPELLELADRMGFLVQVEAFDCWRGSKRESDYGRLFESWHEKDLRAMVRHYRNHPSVFMWSIGNEVLEQGGPDPAKELRDIVHSEDPMRPITAGCNNGQAAINGFQTAVDVFGLNYNLGMYGQALADPANQNKPFYSSESSSCISSRGEYFFGTQHADFQVSSFDLDCPGWGCSPDDQFRALDRHPAFMGEFVWTGFDYLGEPTPYNNDVTTLLNFSDPKEREAMKKELAALGKLRVPSRSSYFGIVDLAGFKKDRFYSYQSRWRPDLPMAHLFPHWNWPERLGQVTPVYLYTTGDEAELFLSGKSLGRKKKGPFAYRLCWDDVVYAPGELRAIAYRNGKRWAEDIVRTTGPAKQLLLSADHTRITADGEDLSFVTVTVADAKGRLVPRSSQLVHFEIEGPGGIVAVDNGDATSHESFQARQRRAFKGLCLAIVRGQPGRAGPVTLKAVANDLSPATILLQTIAPRP